MDVRPLPARTTRLYRVTSRVGTVEHRFYLKIYAPDEHPPEVLAARCHALERVAKAFRDADGLAPYEVIGFEPHRGIVLTAETAGEPLVRLNRPLAWNPLARSEALRAWRGIGRWLRRLHWHSLPPRASTTRPAELVEYAVERFRLWKDQDASCGEIARRAEEAVRVLGRDLEGRQVVLTPCHADISTGNIVVGPRVGLIDLDDFRYDMPGVDVSQALLAIDQFWRLVSMVPMPQFNKAARKELESGYESRLPDGPEFWLPHLSNLSVVVVTLASRRCGMSLSRLSTELHYRRIVGELGATAQSVLDMGNGTRAVASVWDVARERRAELQR